MNADGETIRVLRARRPARNGHDVRLALDLDIQRIAEQELLAGMERARELTDVERSSR